MNRDFCKKLVAFSLGLWALAQPLSIAGANIAIALVLLGLLGYGLGLGGAGKGQARFPSLRSPLEKPLWIYWLAAALCCAAGVNWRAGLGELGKEAQMIWDFYIFSAAFALAPEAQILAPGAAAFVLASVLGAAQFWTSRHPQSALASAMTRASASARFWAWLAPYYRAHASVHPVTYGEIMGFALLGGLAYAADKRRKAQAPGVLAELFCLAAGAGLVLSLTRGALAGFTAGLLLMLALGAWRGLWPELAAMAAGAAAFVLAKPRALGRLKAFNAHESSAAVHVELWRVAWRMFKDRPFLGAGLSNYNTLFGRYHSLPFAGEPSWGNAHNLYLFQLAERGLVGFAALSLLLGTMIVQAWRRARRAPDFVNLWFLSWMAAFLVMNLTESALQVGMVWMPTLALYCLMERSHGSGTFSGPRSYG